jgi:tight adherence protein B
MDPLLLLISLTLAGATTLSVLYTHQRLTAPARIARSRVMPNRGVQISLGSSLRGSRRSGIPFADLLPISADAQAELESRLALAGVPLRVGEFIGMRVLGALGGVVLGAFVAGPVLLLSFGFALAVTVGLMLLGWQIPSLWLTQMRNRRVSKIELQLPVALNAMAKSLRSGTGLLQAIDYTGEQIGEPLGPEFQTTVRQLRLGGDSEEVFAALSARVGSPDLDIAITGIIIQRTVGGNLSEILTSVSKTVDERLKLLREVQVLTSRQKFTGNLIALMPVLVAMAFIFLNPDLGDLLINTTAGRIALAIGLGFEVIGIIAIRKLAKIEV